ncbi:MAG TPA: energy transducer TonB [Puia sp.]|jgi:protein TonB|nr:energy transducer TonB [Puia sp.]
MTFLKCTAAALALCLSFAACNSDSSSSPSSTSGTDSSKNAMASDSSIKDTTAKNASSTAGAKKKKLKPSLGEIASSTNKKYTKDKSGVYDNAEVMPSFKGGSSGIGDYVTSNLNVPQSAADDSKEGTIKVMFIVDETGKVVNAHTMGTKLGDGLDEEVVRVVSSMPKWTPGTIHGKPVKVSLELPIVFKAEE